MKKLVILLSIIAIGFVSFAQDATLDQRTVYASVGGAAGDTIDATATVTKTFKIKVGDLHQYTTAIFLDSISGTPDTVIVRHWGSLDGTNFTTSTIETDTIATGDADNYTILSTIADNGYIYHKYQVLGDGDTMKMKVTLQMAIYQK